MEQKNTTCLGWLKYMPVVYQHCQYFRKLEDHNIGNESRVVCIEAEMYSLKRNLNGFMCTPTERLRLALSSQLELPPCVLPGSKS